MNVVIPDREYHEAWMREAIEMVALYRWSINRINALRWCIIQGELALRSDETPVGCVFVHEGVIIGKGMNDTNKSLNVCRRSLLAGRITSAALLTQPSAQGSRHAEFVALEHILRTHGLAILRSTDLYVTVEPCIMCAAALRQYGIRAVYFGCHNDKFGGTGGVMRIHAE